MSSRARTQAIILGSGRGVRRLDPTQSYPLALEALAAPTAESGAAPASVLEWTLGALKQAGADEPLFVGGYHIQKVVERFPKLRYAFHGEWETQGLLGALRLGLAHINGHAPVLVVLGDTVIRAGAVEALEREAETLSVGLVPAQELGAGKWGRPAARLAAGTSHVLAGVVLIPSKMVARVARCVEACASKSASAGLDDFVRALVAQGEPVRSVDVTGQCASVRSPRDLAAFVLGSKAQTLERLAPHIREAIVPPLVSFSVRQWRENPLGVVAMIERTLAPGRFVVRSSSLLEDRFESSGAGKFHSELNVAIEDVPEAIERVIASYAGDRDEAQIERGDDQVLVQEYVHNARVNGVLFTRSVDDGAPYCVLNAEHVDGRTDTITSGRASRPSTLIRARHAGAPDGEHWSSRVFRLGRRLEELLQHDGLDIEFVVDDAERVHLLQVRPLASSSAARIATRGYQDEDVHAELTSVASAVSELTGPSATLLGERGALGVMPDWNPAEIIGVCPRPLALSVYRHVVTDRVWSRARAELGYRSVEFTPLLHALGGRPFIDVRASLNSLVPASLDDRIADRLITGGIARLRAKPELHDKIEFELSASCADPDVHGLRQRLKAQGLDARDIDAVVTAAACLTSRLLEHGGEQVRSWLSACDTLASERRVAESIASAGNGASCQPQLRAASRLLDSACAYGTLPFAKIARCAFVAVSLLRSLERVGAIDEREHAAVLHGLPSVAAGVARDLSDVRAGRMPQAEFLARHGHLRPGTYDILSPSYAESPETYLDQERSVASVPLTRTSREGDDTSARAVLRMRGPRIASALASAGVHVDVERVIDFICTAIPAREVCKHEFTKNISAALSCIARAGRVMDLSTDDLSFLPVWRLLHLAVETPSPAERTDLQRTAAIARKRHELSLALKLPHLIFEPGDVSAFAIEALRPNFVTRTRTIGPGRFLKAGAGVSPEQLAGAVVLIENADPGYDWLFAHRIAGLVTKYGGVASHMAIRAAEFKLPAAIGCGEAIFNPLVSAPRIELDCAAERVRGAA